MHKPPIRNPYCHLAGVADVVTVALVLVEVDAGLALGIAQGNLEVERLSAVNDTDAVGVVAEGVPVGEVSTAKLGLGGVEGLDGVVGDGLARGGEAGELLGAGETLAALDDEDALDAVALLPVEAAALGVLGNTGEGEDLLDLGLVGVGLEVDAGGGAGGEVGLGGEDVVDDGRLEVSGLGVGVALGRGGALVGGARAGVLGEAAVVGAALEVGEAGFAVGGVLARDVGGEGGRYCDEAGDGGEDAGEGRHCGGGVFELVWWKATERYRERVR